MERIESLTETVRREVADYHGPAIKATTYYFEDLDHETFTVIIVPEYEYPRKEYATVVVLARVVGGLVIIDEDTTDRPLVHELVRAGIPREKIILTYAGEVVPETSSE